jgi:hypothetical protein
LLTRGEWFVHVFNCCGFGVRASGVCASGVLAPALLQERTMPEFKSPSTIPSRGPNTRQAASYWGVLANTFKKLVRLGLAPAPLKLPGLDRNIYDRIALDAAMSARAVQQDEPVGPARSN